MFSGIIEKVGRITALMPEGSSRRLTIETGFGDLALGESVAINGVCLTVTRYDAVTADFFVSPETLDRSNLARLAPGDVVNLERAVTLATRLSGHLVQGHVDGKARLTVITRDGDTRRIELSLPAGLRAFCVEKGSIALDGVSLTLNAVRPASVDDRFCVDVTLIPHTWTHTNLQHCAVGDEINVEVDVMAKYVERLCHAYLTPSPA
jgi:riboflavin synthase